MTDEPEVTSITISPTAEFFLAKEVLVRAWKGQMGDRGAVVAFVASVALPENVAALDLVAVPPPDPAWSEQTRLAMGRLWQLAAKLLDEEATGLTLLAEQFVRFGMERGEMRRKAAQMFLVSAASLLEDPAPDPGEVKSNPALGRLMSRAARLLDEETEALNVFVDILLQNDDLDDRARVADHFRDLFLKAAEVMK